MKSNNKTYHPNAHTSRKTGNIVGDRRHCLQMQCHLVSETNIKVLCHKRPSSPPPPPSPLIPVNCGDNRTRHQLFTYSYDTCRGGSTRVRQKGVIMVLCGVVFIFLYFCCNSHRTSFSIKRGGKLNFCFKNSDCSSGCVD